MAIDPVERARREYRAPTKFTGWGNYKSPVSLGAGTVRIDGLKELDAALKGFSAKFEGNVVRGALRAGMKEIESIARARLATASHGKLSKSLRVSSRLKKGKATAELKVGGGDAWYAKFVEFGTATKYTGTGRTVGKEYHIKPKRKSALKFFWKRQGQWVITKKGVMHPGATAQPFMRPAFDQGSARAVRAFAAYVRKRIAQGERVSNVRSVSAL